MTPKTEYYLDTRVLSLFGVLAALPLIVGGYLIVGSARVSLDESIGRNFAWLAESAASGVDQAVSQEIMHLAALSTSPALVERAATSGRSSSDLDKAIALDSKWREIPDSHPMVGSILNNPASDHLARIVATSPLYTELTLLDASGVVVAASMRPRRYYYGKRPWFVKSGGGSEEGWLSLTVQRDPDVEADVVTMAWPVRRGDQVVGVLRSVLDARTLFAPVAGFRFGETGHAVLFQQKDGLILSGTAAEVSLAGRYGALADFRRAAEAGRRFFVTANGELVGYSELGGNFGNLDWAVAIQQSLAEAHAPLSDLTRNLVLYFLAMGAAVLVLALYLSFKLEKTVTDVEVDLHREPLRP